MSKDRFTEGTQSFSGGTRGPGEGCMYADLKDPQTRGDVRTGELIVAAAQSFGVDLPNVHTGADEWVGYLPDNLTLQLRDHGSRMTRTILKNARGRVATTKFNNDQDRDHVLTTLRGLLYNLGVNNAASTLPKPWKDLENFPQKK
jgi:hypothetical protein